MIVWWSMTAGDVFSPPREDFLTGEALAYMRRG